MNFKMFDIVGCIREWLLAKEIARVEKELRDIEDKLDMFFHEFLMKILVDTNVNLVKIKRLWKIHDELSVYRSILKTSYSIKYAKDRMKGYRIPTHQDTLFLIYNTYI